MSQILVKHDPSLTKPEIIIPLTNSSEKEMGRGYDKNQGEIQQTSIYGIVSPLIQINNIMINFDEVQAFELSSTGVLPTVRLICVNKNNFLSTIDIPGNDNELIIQIIPPFDNIYKKINLVFYINRIKNLGGNIEVSGIYKSPKLFETQFKSFGKINTYKLFEDISNESKLGFASNTQMSNSEDRYIYCNNINYKTLLNDELISNDERCIYDWWVDFWDYMNLVDIYDKYTTIDSGEDMNIWISTQRGEITEGIEQLPHKVKAEINNHPISKTGDLYVEKYKIFNKPGKTVYEGSDKVYSIYRMDDNDYNDHLIQDGDIKNDIYKKYEYMGEVYGAYDYFLPVVEREAFMQKIQSNSIEVTLNHPLLSLYRGRKVDFIWYINDARYQEQINMLQEQDILNTNISSNIPLNDDPDGLHKSNYENKTGEFVIDKNISGQYLITKFTLKYLNGHWKTILTMNRPPITDKKLNMK